MWLIGLHSFDIVEKKIKKRIVDLKIQSASHLMLENSHKKWFFYHCKTKFSAVWTEQENYWNRSANFIAINAYSVINLASSRNVSLTTTVHFSGSSVRSITLLQIWTSLFESNQNFWSASRTHARLKQIKSKCACTSVGTLNLHDIVRQKFIRTVLIK